MQVHLSHPQTMDSVDMAIHRVVCQKSDYHGNSDFQNSQKWDTLQIKAKKISGQNVLAFQRYFGARNWPLVHYKSKIRYTYAIWFVWSCTYFLTEGSAKCNKGNLPKFRCYIFKKMTDPSFAPPTWMAISAISIVYGHTWLFIDNLSTLVQSRSSNF
jgi:hypothetical protein